MHSSFFTPAIGLGILSLTSARVLEKRETCWQDPPYKGLWNNPDIYDDVNGFCAGLLGLQAGNYCVFNKTATVTSRESITATSTITTARTVSSTKFETITHTDFHFNNKRDVLDVVTNADFLEDARLAIKRQAPMEGGLNLEGPLHSACSCGNAAGRITLTPTPKICTNWKTKWEQGFATAYAYTQTITSGVTTVTVIVNETGIISTSKASLTSFALVSLTSSAEDVEPTFNDQGHWWRDHGFNSPSRSAASSATTTTTRLSVSVAISTSASTSDPTSSISSSYESQTHNWGNWKDFNLIMSTSVQVDPNISNATSATSTSSSSTSVQVSASTSDSTSAASTSLKPNSPLSRTFNWRDWSDHNIARTTSAVSVAPTVANTTISSVQNITSQTVTLAPNTTTSSFEVSPNPSNATTTVLPNATSPHSGWQDWNVTKTSHMVHPTLINATTTTSVYPNATTTSFFNTTSATAYQNTTTTSLYNMTSTIVSPNLTSTTASTSCLGKSTVYLGNLTTTITQTMNFTQPGNTVTQFVSITQSASTVIKTKTMTEYKNKRPHRGGWSGHW